MRCWLPVLVACGPSASALDEPPPPPSPPLARGAIALDGLADEPTWQLDALHATLAPPRATDLRLLRDRASLYVFVDARDRDLAADHTITVHRTQLAPTGPLPPHAARLVAGTVGDPHDDDLGVRYELAIPLGELGPPPVAFAIERCDGPASCATATLSLWPGT